MLEFLRSESLSKYTSYKIGGPADYFIQPRSIEDLREVSGFIRLNSCPYFIMGAGSNVLVSDLGFRGLVIQTSKLNLSFTKLSESVVELGASLPISYVLNKSISLGFGGFENWVGIPGTVGGTIAMNAGTHLGETKKNLISYQIFDLLSGEVSTIEAPGEKMTYRKNENLLPHQVIVSGVFKIEAGESHCIKSKITELLEKRKATQPVEFPSCGSVFKNPKMPNYESAWKVIEALGLKGYSVGGAEFSKKHANFIVNKGGAKADEVFALITIAKELAKEKLGIELHEEVKYLGENFKTK